MSRASEQQRSQDEVFLSIVIPTYNRAEKLDHQLSWLAAELVDIEVSYSVRIYDNASPDSTPEVCARWQEKIPGLEVQRRDENIGLLPNVIGAASETTGTWTWAISDDDRLRPGVAARVVGLLQANPDLSLLYLNHRGVDESGAITKAEFLDSSVSGRLEDGMAAFSYHVERDMGCVMGMTETVFRTSLFQDAVRAWKGDIKNWAIYVFLTGYAAARGPIYITPEIEIDCLEGSSYWSTEPGAWTRAIYQEIPSAFLQLAHDGYPEPMCRKLGLQTLDSVSWWSFRDHVRATRKSPSWLVTLPRLALLSRS